MTVERLMLWLGLIALALIAWGLFDFVGNTPP